MATALFHGAHSTLTIGHEGQCFVDEYDRAECYGRNVFGAVLDLDALNVERCDGYDHTTNEAPADCAEFRAAAAARGVDVLVYDDADECGREHTCWRLVSDRAVEMVRASGVEIDDEDEAYDFEMAA